MLESCWMLSSSADLLARAAGQVTGIVGFGLHVEDSVRRQLLNICSDFTQLNFLHPLLTDRGNPHLDYTTVVFFFSGHSSRLSELDRLSTVDSWQLMAASGGARARHVRGAADLRGLLVGAGQARPPAAERRALHARGVRHGVELDHEPRHSGGRRLSPLLVRAVPSYTACVLCHMVSNQQSTKGKPSIRM